MAVEKYLAFDLGAGSGRGVLGELSSSGILTLTEIHRFSNQTFQKGGTLYWNTCGQCDEIKKGLARCAGKYPGKLASVGIDTWGVDFGLLDASDRLISNAVSYRDKRTDGIPEVFFKIMPRERLYKLTGIQIMQFNTVFQLFAMVKNKDKALKNAKTLLFTPDLLNFFLTGEKAAEFTMATTSQLYDPKKKTFSSEIFNAIGADIGLMADIVMPGNVLGKLLPEVSENAKFLHGVPVVNIASHDTASAIAAIPAASSDFAYISSGSWSLIGFEANKPCITKTSSILNYTNEGGVDGTFRILKNINGLWIIQEIRRELCAKGKDVSFADLTASAAKANPFTSVINPNAPCFLKPGNMLKRVKEFCLKTGQKAPSSDGELVRVVLESLALSYKEAMEEIKMLRGKKPACIHIIGGGANNPLLCEFTASATSMPVYAGPAEATSAGNILVQAMAMGRLKSLNDIRMVSRSSFKPILYEPKKDSGFDTAYDRFLKLKRRKN